MISEALITAGTTVQADDQPVSIKVPPASTDDRIDPATVKPSDILKAARAKLALGWCQGSMVRDASGKPIDLYSEDGCKFCMLGAIATSLKEILKRPPSGSDDYQPYDAARNAFIQANSVEGVGAMLSYNDYPGRTQEEMLAATDKAIAYAESRGL